MFCECISRQEVIPSHQVFGCQDSPWCGIQPADLWSSRHHCDSEFEPPQKVTEKYWEYIGKSWEVQLSDCQEKREKNKQRTKSQICQTTHFATFPARSGYEHLWILSSLCKPKKTFKKLQATDRQTAAKLHTYEVSVSNPQSLALLSGTELANILGNMSGNKSESFKSFNMNLRVSLIWMCLSNLWDPSCRS